MNFDLHFVAHHVPGKCDPVMLDPGSAGVEMDVVKSHVAYGGIVVAKAGTGIEHDGVALARHMMGDEVQIEVHLGSGKGSAKMIGIDLGPGYIKENSKTS